jgi:hypothetical protein
MLPFVYLIVIVCLVLLILSFYFKEWALAVITGMLMVVTGIYIFNYGILGEFNFLITSFATIFLSVGFYVLVRGVLDKIEKQ